MRDFATTKITANGFESFVRRRNEVQFDTNPVTECCLFQQFGGDVSHLGKLKSTLETDSLKLVKKPMSKM